MCKGVSGFVSSGYHLTLVLSEWPEDNSLEGFSHLNNEPTTLYHDTSIGETLRNSRLSVMIRPYVEQELNY